MNENNRGTRILRGNKAYMLDEERSKQSIIRTYKDEKTGVWVTVLEGPVDTPYKGLPHGFRQSNNNPASTE